MFWFMLILSMFKFPFLFNNATTINILFIYILNEPFNELLTYATNMHFVDMPIDSKSAKYYTHVCETVQSHLKGGGGVPCSLFGAVSFFLNCKSSD